MNKSLVAACLSLAVAVVGPAVAWAAEAATAAPAAAASPSVETTPIVELVDNPKTKAVLDKHIPGVADHPSYDMFKGMSLRQLEPMSQGLLTDDMLTAIQGDLTALHNEHAGH